MAQIGPKGRSRAPGGSAHLFVSLIRKSRRFYITYQKMKEIGPIPRYVHFRAGHPTGYRTGLISGDKRSFQVNNL